MLRIGLLCSLGIACGLLAPGSLYADSPEQILEMYAVQGRAADPAFTAFSVDRGEAFYREPHVLRGAGAWSCASCHLN